MKPSVSGRQPRHHALIAAALLALGFLAVLVSIGVTVARKIPGSPAALAEGMDAPNFSAPAADGSLVSLADFRGKVIVLYFYPKNDTPGCTREACNFRDAKARMAGLGVVVLGVSRDKVASHQKFREKYALNFATLSDADGKIHDLFGAWKAGSIFGRTALGVDRSTFLIDKEGAIRRIWRGVSVNNHAREVMEAVRALS